MNAAVDRFNLLRDAIRQIQLELGVNPQGSASSLKDRLSVRVADSGITRGLLHFHDNSAGTPANADAGLRTNLSYARATATLASGSGVYDVALPAAYSGSLPDTVIVRHEMQWSTITSNSSYWRACHVHAIGPTNTVQIVAYDTNDCTGLGTFLSDAIWSPMTVGSFTVQLLIFGGG
jgi:hypothetical protein